MEWKLSRPCAEKECPTQGQCTGSNLGCFVATSDVKADVVVKPDGIGIVTYIVGFPGKSTIAIGLRAALLLRSRRPVVINLSAGGMPSPGRGIPALARDFTDVLICWQDEPPADAPDPDILITITLSK